MFFAFFTWLQWICPPVFFKSYNPHWYVVGFLFPLWRNIRVSSRFSPPVSLLTPPNLLLLFPINFYVFFVILPLLTPYSFTRLLILHLERVKERGQASFFFWIFPVNVDCCFFFFWFRNGIVQWFHYLLSFWFWFYQIIIGRFFDLMNVNLHPLRSEIARKQGVLLFF